MPTYTGKVFAGKGIARTRVSDNLALYERKSGIRFFPGTLNVKLPSPPTLPAAEIHIDADEIRTSGHKTGIGMTAACLNGEPVFLLRPDNPVYEPDVIEVVAAINLRERFNLKNGDEVTIEVPAH